MTATLIVRNNPLGARFFQTGVRRKKYKLGQEREKERERERERA